MEYRKYFYFAAIFIFVFTFIENIFLPVPPILLDYKVEILTLDIVSVWFSLHYMLKFKSQFLEEFKKVKQ